MTELTLRFPAVPHAVPDLARLALTAARGIGLDFSPASLRPLEGVIERWRTDTVEDLEASLFYLGCYVGEVLRRERGGTWVLRAAAPAHVQQQLFSELLLELPRHYIDPIARVLRCHDDGATGRLTRLLTEQSGDDIVHDRNAIDRGVIIVLGAHRSIVRVVAHALEYDLDSPWIVEESTSRGIAVYLGDGRLLAPAHLVVDALSLAELELEHPGSMLARVVAISHDTDLALLALVDPADAHHFVAIEVGAMVDVGDEVVFHATSEDATAPTSNVASVDDVRFVRCVHSQRKLLVGAVRWDGGEVDGGVVVAADGRLAGLVIQRVTEDDGLHEFVASPLIHTFLARKQGSLERPVLGFTTQPLVNEAMRRALHLGETDEGVLVIGVDHGSPADGLVQRDDILLEVDGHAVGREGSIDFLSAHWLHHDVITNVRSIGDTIDIRVRRGRDTRSIRLPLAAWQPLVPRSRYEKAPLYLFYGGLLFQHVTRDYLASWEEWWNKGPKEFLHHYYTGKRTATQHELVALAKVFDHPLVDGYAHLHTELVATVNGHVPLDMADFVARLSRATGLVRIETTSGGVIVLDTDAVRRETPQMCHDHGIPRDRTRGLGRRDVAEGTSSGPA